MATISPLATLPLTLHDQIIKHIKFFEYQRNYTLVLANLKGKGFAYGELVRVVHHLLYRNPDLVDFVFSSAAFRGESSHPALRPSKGENGIYNPSKQTYAELIAAEQQAATAEGRSAALERFKAASVQVPGIEERYQGEEYHLDRAKDHEAKRAQHEQMEADLVQAHDTHLVKYRLSTSFHSKQMRLGPTLDGARRGEFGLCQNDARPYRRLMVIALEAGLDDRHDDLILARAEDEAERGRAVAKTQLFEWLFTDLSMKSPGDAKQSRWPGTCRECLRLVQQRYTMRRVLKMDVCVECGEALCKEVMIAGDRLLASHITFPLAFPRGWTGEVGCGLKTYYSPTLADIFVKLFYGPQASIRDQLSLGDNLPDASVRRMKARFDLIVRAMQAAYRQVGSLPTCDLEAIGLDAMFFTRLEGDEAVWNSYPETTTFLRQAAASCANAFDEYSNGIAVNDQLWVCTAVANFLIGVIARKSDIYPLRFLQYYLRIEDISQLERLLPPSEPKLDGLACSIDAANAYSSLVHQCPLKLAMRLTEDSLESNRQGAVYKCTVAVQILQAYAKPVLVGSLPFLAAAAGAQKGSMVLWTEMTAWLHSNVSDARLVQNPNIKIASEVPLAWAQSKSADFWTYFSQRVEQACLEWASTTRIQADALLVDGCNTGTLPGFVARTMEFARQRQTLDLL